jgi:hypothetical protein
MKQDQRAGTARPVSFKGSLARNIFSSDYAHLATGYEGYIDEKIQNPLH